MLRVDSVIEIWVSIICIRILTVGKLAEFLLPPAALHSNNLNCSITFRVVREIEVLKSKERYATRVTRPCVVATSCRSYEYSRIIRIAGVGSIANHESGPRGVVIGQRVLLGSKISVLSVLVIFIFHTRVRTNSIKLFSQPAVTVEGIGLM